MDNRKLSIYNGVRDNRGRDTTFEAVLARIQHGGRNLREKTQNLNKWYHSNPVKYDERKLQLPAVTWSGRFEKGKRTGEGLLEHSGLIVLDVDNDIDMGTVLADFAHNPHVLLAFVSPSGQGVKPVIPIHPIPQNATEHTHAFNAVLEVFSEYAEQDPEHLPKQRDVNRLCFLAHDPRLIYNPNAKPVEWEIDEQAEQQQFESQQRHETAQQTSGDVSIETAKHILSFVPRDLAYADWRNIGMGIKQAGLPVSVFQDWSNNQRLNSSGVWVSEDCLSHWNRYNSHGITWGSVVHIAKQNGYKPPRSSIRRPVKLHKNVVSMLTETLDASREFLTSVFSKNKIKFFGLRADTGVGKNEKAITFYFKGFSGLVNVPTKDLSKEQQARFEKAGIDAFRYRGILSNPDGEFPDENPCLHAVRYDAIASRGWNAYQFLCEHCEVREVCEERGYRSQAEQAKKAQVTVMPFPDIFMNPAFRTLAKDFLPTYHDDLILHDEFDPANSFLKIDVPKARLQQLRDDWKGYDPSQFAKEILRILEVEGDLSLLRPFILGLTGAEYNSILEGLTSAMWNGQILSREDAHRCDAFRAKTHNTEQILTLPRLETDGWNLLVQLELFFQRYKRDADMPMKYENNTLTFYLPPLPMKTRARMGFMSATLSETFFRRVMDAREKKHSDVSYHDTGLTEWHPKAKVFQLRTNRNPRKTAYNPKGERVDGDLLSPSGEFYFQLVADDLQNENRGLITYQALLEATPFDEGVKTANFGGLVGLDTHFKDVDVLHILFSPELPLSTVAFKAKKLFGDDTEPLCYDRDEDGNYIDARLQACYEDGVISEIIQSVGRGRPVSRDATIVVWCSHFLPGITDREQTLLFDEVDWQAAEGDISKLADVVLARESAEQNGDVQAYAEATGQSDRTARRHTQDTRQQTKAERDAEIHRRYDGGNGETQQEIADDLDVNVATVNRVLNP